MIEIYSLKEAAEWRDIEGLEGLYQVSSAGQVKGRSREEAAA